MKVKQMLRIVLPAVICMMLLPGLVHADIYLKYKQRTEAFEIMGQKQPARETVRETWIAKDMIRTDEGPQTMIMRIDKKQIYLLDNQAQTYSEFPMDMQEMARQAIEEDQEMSPQEKEEARDFVEGMMKGMSEFRVTVEDTGQTKKIGPWNCRKYVQTTNTAMGPSETVLWATKDIDLDYDLLHRMAAASMMMMPGMQESMDDFIKEMKKIDGVTVHSVSTSAMMDAEIRTTQDLLDYSDKKTSEEFYTVPENYLEETR
ncbi:MAG: DUF4412 domain-containing protein [Desulfomonilia bacterium]|jgi:hypothetical protein|uniref:DUF4412 domain-containing protein n=1 Tax=anaerobic digester metagenome TaxID=1263854 RepID=A0A485M631_9ZZZZ|nr:DUF4412 domain-containing protein [Pseudomonadota bacterium]HON39113.1 DUF4412 domain-containing protein [Deltaproteobacteria bacterium]HRS56131.1 DUF4412 domain-containing protein [Desulfomonilia bacterium]HPD21192.1 DUF4412 domain-containing protein [Deltaproteobacteria bacterium]HPX18159.1 DUF4412 domain-containing protein [Deltaproteobacteria bacterium]